MKEISGDYKLTRIQKISYVFLNIYRGIVGWFWFLRTTGWHPTTIPFDSDTPFRKYVDTFITEKIPTFFTTKKHISILDIGCGSGYIRSLLGTRYHGTYVGIDVYKEADFSDYDTTSFTTTFVQVPIEQYVTNDRFDLVISNTSLEHISSDRTAVQKASVYTARSGYQIHIIPGTWSLPLYLFHGYRQYSRYMISRLFPQTNKRVYRIGGLCSFLFHLFYITIPERIVGIHYSRTREYYFYKRVSQWCIKMDRFLPLCPFGYIIVIPHE